MAKGGKGIPRVTNKVLQLDDAGRKEWLQGIKDKVSPEQLAVIQGKLAKGQGKQKAGKVKKLAVDNRPALGIGFFKQYSFADLMEAKEKIRLAIDDKKQAELDELNAQIKSAEERKKAIQDIDKKKPFAPAHAPAAPAPVA